MIKVFPVVIPLIFVTANLIKKPPHYRPGGAQKVPGS
jgi:hypothetical protein